MSEEQNQTFGWSEQVVVITGGSSGIGAALARELHRRGAKLVLAARRADRLNEVAASLGDSCLPLPADVTRRQDVDRIFSAARQRFGQIDVWVNNAGRGISKLVADLTDEDLDAMMSDNVKSALYGMQAVLPHFKERGRGHLVNVSSMLGRTPWVPVRSAYSAAKHALNSLTENLRMELRQGYPGIVVSCVHPGPVATDFGSNALGGGPDSRTLPGAQTAEEVATVIAAAIETGREDVYTRPEFLQQVLGYYQALAAGGRHPDRTVT